MHDPPLCNKAGGIAAEMKEIAGSGVARVGPTNASMNDVVEVEKEHTAGIEVFDDIVEHVTGSTLHELEKRGFHERVTTPDDSSSAIRFTRTLDCKLYAMAWFAAAHGEAAWSSRSPHLPPCALLRWWCAQSSRWPP